MLGNIVSITKNSAIVAIDKNTTHENGDLITEGEAGTNLRYKAKNSAGEEITVDSFNTRIIDDGSFIDVKGQDALAMANNGENGSVITFKK